MICVERRLFVLLIFDGIVLTISLKNFLFIICFPGNCAHNIVFL